MGMNYLYSQVQYIPVMARVSVHVMLVQGDPVSLSHWQVQMIDTPLYNDQINYYIVFRHQLSHTFVGINIYFIHNKIIFAYISCHNSNYFL